MTEKAEAIRCRRFESVVNERYDFFDRYKLKGDFLEYYRQQLRKHDQKWEFVYLHFKNFVHGKCTFEEIDIDLCNKFREYLLNVKKLRRNGHISQNSASGYWSTFRGFLKILYRNGLIKTKESIPLEIKQPSDTITPEVKVMEVIEVPTVKNDYTDGYDERIAEIEREKAEQQAEIMRVMHEYTTYSMAEFLSKDDLITLHENIECFAHGQCDLYKPIRSKFDNPLNTLDIRHFVWNIGIRFLIR